MRVSSLLLVLAVAWASLGETGGARVQPQQTACPIPQCLEAACSSTPQADGGVLWQCTACAAPFTTNTDLSACVCPAGTYANDTGECVACEVGFFCPQGQDPAVSNKTACPRSMVTLEEGASNIGACVNMPGYRYVTTSAGPSAVACKRNEYCTGLKKQAKCDKCPPGFVTDIRNTVGSHTSSAICVAPPGFYVVSDTRVAPCVQGEYKEDYSAATRCSQCSDELGPGITTAGEGSTSVDDCNYLEPGFALVNEKGKVILTFLGDGPDARVFTKAKRCPQSYYCPGGNPSLRPVEANSAVPRPCGNGMWTQFEGAHEPSMCQVPPGYKMGPQWLTECANGEFREGFKRPEEATTCTPCGVGTTAGGVTAKWLSDRTFSIIQLDANTGAVYRRRLVRGNGYSCYIQRGMGSVFVRSGRGYVLSAMLCPPDFYGVNSKRYGLKATPCRACPPNMATTSAPETYRASIFLDAASKPTPLPTPAGMGFEDIRACLPKPGFGYAAGSAVICGQGWWSAGGDTNACTKCLDGTTTTGPGKAAASHCNRLLPGYGGLSRTPQLCPVATYLRGGEPLGTPCQLCEDTSTVPPGHAHTKTASTGSSSIASCSHGYGAPRAGMDCTSCNDGLYGPASRSSTPCLACPADRTYTFAWDKGRDLYVPRATSRDAASRLDDCIAEFAQVVDGAFYLDIRGGALARSPQFLQVPLITGLTSCATSCRESGVCVAVTFNHATLECFIWSPPPTPAGDWSLGGLAMKTFRSSNAALSRAALADEELAWTYWKTNAKDVMDAFIGFEDEALVPSVMAVAATTLQACQQACTEGRLCAGVVFGRWVAPTDVADAGSDTSIEAIGDSEAWGSNTAQYTLGTYGAACCLINGVVAPDSPKRSLVRAKPANLAHTYCPPGTFRQADGACVACGASEFSADADAAACTSCSPPFSSTTYGCGCPAGSALTADGQACEPCVGSSSWSEAGNRLRTCRAECPAGYVVDGAKAGCIKCAGELVPSADGTACGCDGLDRRVADAVAGTCEPCEPDTTWRQGVNTATTCSTLD